MVGISDSHDEGHKMTNPTDTNPAIEGDLLERLKRNLNDRRLLDGNVGDYNPERVYNIDVGDDDLEQAITALQAQAAQSKRDAAEIERLRGICYFASQGSNVVGDNGGAIIAWCKAERLARKYLSHKEEW